MTTEELVPVDAAELCVQGFGDRSDPPVLLVAGAASSMDWWDDELCSRLAAGGFRVVRYDHRDTGRSTTGPPGHPTYDAGALERDAVALAEWLGPPVHLVGLSMGGGIAQSLALHRPDLVATLTLVATSPVGGVEASLPGPDARLSGDPLPEPDRADADAVVEHLVTEQRAYAGRASFDEGRTRRVARRVVERSHDAASAGNHWLVVGGDDDEPPLDVTRIDVPTLVVHGTDDPLFPLPHGRALADAVSDARLLVVDGMGHEVPPPPTWDVVVPALLAHLSGA